MYSAIHYVESGLSTEYISYHICTISDNMAAFHRREMCWSLINAETDTNLAHHNERTEMNQYDRTPHSLASIGQLSVVVQARI